MPTNRLFMPEIKLNEQVVPEYYIADSSIVVGNGLVVTEDTVSGFSSTSYLNLGASKRINGTFYVHFKTPSSFNFTGKDHVDVIHAEKWLFLGVWNTGNLCTYNWSASSPVNIVTNVPTDTEYWVKFEVNGYSRIVYLSTDGETYTQVASFSDSSCTPSYSNNFFLGQQSWTSTTSTDLSWPGEIYLNDFKIEGYCIGSSTTVRGNLSVSQNSVSGFSSTNYGIIPYHSNNVESLEVNAKVKYVYSSTWQGIYGNSSVNRDTPQLDAESSKFRMWLSNNGSSWESSTMSDTLISGEWYTINVTWNNVDKTPVMVVTDSNDVSYTVEGTATNNVYWVGDIHLGADIESGVWTGEIALNDCYIKVNGEKVWQGSIYLAEYTYPINVRYIRTYDLKRYYPEVYLGEKHILTGYEIKSNVGDIEPVYSLGPLLTKVGSLSVDYETGKCSNFSDSNYMYFNKDLFSYGTTRFEAQFVFDFNEASSSRYIYYSDYLRLYLTSAKKLRFMKRSGNTTQIDVTGATVLDFDTKYYAKITFNTTDGYAVYLSTDGETWDLEISSTANKAAPSSSSSMYIGRSTSSGYYLRGNIYLKECYIKPNGWAVWDGNPVVSNPYTNVVGTDLVITENTVSNFGSKSWLDLGKNGRQYGTYYIHFRTPKEALTRTECIIHSEYWLTLSLSQSYGLYSYSFQNGSYHSLIPWAQLQWDTDYWVKIEIAGTTKNVYISMDGETYTLAKFFSDTGINQTSRSVFYIGQISDGSELSTDYSFAGIVYIKDFKIEGTAEYGLPEGITAVGDLNIGRYVSGFSSSKYLRLDEYFEPQNAETWEMGFKVVYSTSGSSYQRFCGALNNTSVAQIVIGVESDNRLSMWLSSNGTSWNVASGVRGSTTLVNGNTYYLKATFDGTKYRVILSPDGGNTWYLEMEVVTSTKLYNNNSYFLIGNAELSGYWNGSFDLSECYIKVDNEYFWKGDTGSLIPGGVIHNNDIVPIYDVKKKDNFLNTNGQPRVTYENESHVISGFQYTGYAVSNTYSTFNLSKTVASGYVNSYEIKLKAKITELNNDYGTIMDVYNSNSDGFRLQMSSNNGVRLGWYNGGSSSYQYMYAFATVKLLTEKFYWFKWVYDGTDVKTYYSYDGENYTLYSTYTHSYPPRFSNANYYFGQYRSLNSSSYVFKGCVDLNETSITVNGDVLWQGVKTKQLETKDIRKFAAVIVPKED